MALDLQSYFQSLAQPQPRPQSAFPAGYTNPAQVKAMQDYANALLANSQQPVAGTKWAGPIGLAGNVVDALMGRQGINEANQAQLGALSSDVSKQPQAPGGIPVKSDNAPSDTQSALPGGASNTTSVESSNVPAEEKARVAGIETPGAKNPYTVVADSGKGDLVLGKYQVKESNLAPWTKQVFGKELSVPEFLGNPAAQEAVFSQIYGGYRAKYGPEGAGRAWFAGPGNVNNPNASDKNGMTAGRYGAIVAGNRSPTSAMAFNGQPASDGGDAQSAITMALAKGGTPTNRGIPTVPGVPNQTAQNDAPIIAPFAVPQRPQVPRSNYEQLQASPWQSDAQKAVTRGEYMEQNQPIGVPYMGNTVIVNPRNPSQQFFSPALLGGVEKGPVGERPVREYIGPDGKLHDLHGDAPVGTQGGAPAGTTPPPLKVPEPIVPPAAAPAAVPGPSGAVVPPPAAPAPPVGPVGAAAAPSGAALALNGPGGPSGAPSPVASAVKASMGIQQPPAPAETGNAAVTNAQQGGPLPPPSIMPGPPPPVAASPMGDKVAAALGASPGVTPTPVGPQIAENSQQFHQRMMDEGVSYEQRKELAKSDAEQYTKNLQTYSDVGIRANKSLPPLEIASQMLKDPRYYSGLFSAPYKILQQAKAGLGIDKAAAAPMEIFDKILSGNIVTELKTMLGGLGQIRLAEINLITNSVANKYNTPAANAAVLGMMNREAKQAATIGQIATQYAKGWQLNDQDQWVPRTGQPTNAGLQDQVSGYTTRHPLFTDGEIANIQHIFDISTKTPNEKVPADKTKADLSEAAHIGFGTPAEAAPAAGAAPLVPSTPPPSSNIIRYDATGKRVQ